jgi:hypothetical protein
MIWFIALSRLSIENTHRCTGLVTCFIFLLFQKIYCNFTNKNHADQTGKFSVGEVDEISLFPIMFLHMFNYSFTALQFAPTSPRVLVARAAWLWQSTTARTSLRERLLPSPPHPRLVVISPCSLLVMVLAMPPRLPPLSLACPR